MLELPGGQLIAGSLAIAFVLIGGLALVRLSRVTTAILVLSLLGVPTVGLVVFVLDPRPLHTGLDIVLLAFPFVGLGLGAAAVTFSERLPRRRSEPYRSLRRSVLAMLTLWASLVGAISVVLYAFEPDFAAFNLYANALWFLGWLPRAWRRGKSRYSIVIAAPAERVFAFVADTQNWPRYLPDIEVAAVSPPGPLSEGTRVTVRQRVDYRGLRGPRLVGPDAIERTSVVTALEPNRRVVSRSVDLDATSTTTLEPVDGGTRLSVVSEVSVPYRLAVLGAIVEWWLIAARRDTETARSWNRLKELVEQQP